MKTPTVKPKKINSREKGAAAERELSAILRVSGWPGAMRGQQRSGTECADIIGGPAGYHLEAKRVEHLRLWPAIYQAQRDAKSGEVPVVVTRKNNAPWVAILPLGRLLALLRRDAGLLDPIECSCAECATARMLGMRHTLPCARQPDIRGLRSAGDPL